MEEAMFIQKEIERLQAAMDEYKRRLAALQQACDHQFDESPLSRTCVKCLLSESLYY
ncbi:hypothetical protein ACAF76_005120 [Brevibacillus sp. TJ4]|uniref:hypothetical protein n=1 Tax=Brevibacillus sp. TJ4 TaxID=3234853 RepID=UPI0037D57698